MTARITTILTALGLSLLPGLAFAHPGLEAHAHGLAQGFLHPFSGVDHILAMVMVGVLAWRLGQRAMVQVPAAFLGAMALGGGLGLAGLAPPGVEAGIALSVVVIAGLLVLTQRVEPGLAVGLVATFALFHGFAHGAELPALATGMGYATGFLAATALLHLSGLMIGAWIGQTGLRVAGATASLAGAVLLIGAL